MDENRRCHTCGGHGIVVDAQTPRDEQGNPSVHEDGCPVSGTECPDCKGTGLIDPDLLMDDGL